MFPGLLAELIDASASCTEAHAAAIAVHALIGIGNAVGRGPCVYVGETRHGLNENALVVGPTASARKGDARHVGLALLAAADPTHVVTSGLSSGEGVIHAVRDPASAMKNGDEVLIDAGVQDKRLLVVEPEFSNVLKQFRRESNILSGVLRDSWDGSRVLRTLTKTSHERATEAHISVIGHSTPEELRAHLADLDVANGCANRFLLIAAARARTMPSPQRLSALVRTQLADGFWRVIEHGHGVGELRRTPAAENLWCQRYPELTADRPGLLGALLARGAPHVVRLSAIFAVLDLARAIDVAHLTAALTWWDYCQASAEVIFADRTGNDTADRIRTEMLSGQAMTLTTIREQLFGGKISAGRLRDALDLLRQRGEVDLDNRQTSGRPAVVVTRVAMADGGGPKRVKREEKVIVGGQLPASHPFSSFSARRDVQRRDDGRVPFVDVESDGSISDHDEGNGHDPYLPTAPTKPCRVCDGTAWHRAGSGWTCSTCHPLPSASPPREHRALDALGQKLVALAAQRGWPTIAFARGHSVGGDQEVWQRFAAFGLPNDRERALAQLELRSVDEVRAAVTRGPTGGVA
jgi:hypothetical protein